MILLGCQAKAGSIQIRIRMLSKQLFRKNRQHHMNIRILDLKVPVRLYYILWIAISSVLNSEHDARICPVKK